MVLIQKNRLIVVGIIFAVFSISALFIFLQNNALQETVDINHEHTIISVPEGMVLIPAGEFEMGINYVDAPPNDEYPVHTAFVDTFFIDENEVTNAEYKRFLIENPQWQKERIDDRLHNGNYLANWNGNNYPDGKSDHPVTYVSWYAAMAYAEWLGKRLPAEAEWERAARGGLEGKKYPWGNKITDRDANYNHNISDTTLVGKFPHDRPNNYGLFDMAGNVWEWCLDEHDLGFSVSFPVNSETSYPFPGVNMVDWLMNNFTRLEIPRVFRGGSWASAAQSVRCASRVRTDPSEAYFSVGFRCAMTATP